MPLTTNYKVALKENERIVQQMHSAGSNEAIGER